VPACQDAGRLDSRKHSPGVTGTPKYPLAKTDSAVQVSIGEGRLEYRHLVGRYLLGLFHNGYALFHTYPIARIAQKALRVLPPSHLVFQRRPQKMELFRIPGFHVLNESPGVQTANLGFHTPFSKKWIWESVARFRNFVCRFESVNSFVWLKSNAQFG
jgi:hypothetical protein